MMKEGGVGNRPESAQRKSPPLKRGGHDGQVLWVAWPPPPTQLREQGHPPLGQCLLAGAE